MIATCYGHTDVVKELAYRGAELDLKTVKLILILAVLTINVFHISQSAGDTALHIATIRNKCGVLEALVALEADLDATNKVFTDTLTAKLCVYSNICLITVSGWLDRTDGGN